MHYFTTKYNYNYDKSIEVNTYKIKEARTWFCVFVGDFISYGNRDAVNKALERLVEKGRCLGLHVAFMLPQNGKSIWPGYGSSIA